ncbi:MAG: glycosyltransferase, partial [Dysgonamonadaceae bacterium]|nr:glycosyltransferase [Dysgonamonadaceae bacterium]
VISTNEGGIPDIVEDGISGFIVEKQNPEMLAAKIEELINHSELRINMGVAGQKKFKENYTLEIFEKRMCEILHEIL